MTFSQPINLNRWVEAFHADENVRNHGNCGAVHPGKALRGD